MLKPNEVLTQPLLSLFIILRALNITRPIDSRGLTYGTLLLSRLHPLDVLTATLLLQALIYDLPVIASIQAISLRSVVALVAS